MKSKLKSIKESDYHHDYHHTGASSCQSCNGDASPKIIFAFLGASNNMPNQLQHRQPMAFSTSCLPINNLFPPLTVHHHHHHHAPRGVCGVRRSVAMARAKGGMNRANNKSNNKSNKPDSSSPRRRNSKSTSGNGNGNVNKSAIPGEEKELSSLFEEDVDVRLGDANYIEAALQKIKRLDEEQERKRAARQKKVEQDGQVPVDRALQQALPKSRDEAIELLVKGAWWGIGLLVSLFFIVHLFIVGDWVGRSP